MASYEILEHTADVAVKATADSFADALEYLGRGMFAVICKPDTVRPEQTVTVSVDALDREELVVAWLNELLFLYDADGFLAAEYDIELSNDEHSLTAQCRGETVDPSRHRLLTDVKAATYHDLHIRDGDQTTVQVVLDV